MATYKQLQREPAFRELFSKRITTLQDIYNIFKDSTFIAIDTEHFPITSGKDRILHQVGLAHIQSLTRYLSQTNDTSRSTGRPCFEDFYNENKIRALALNINISQEKRERIIRLKGEGGVPTRRRHRFGREQQVDLENLEETVIEFIQSCEGKGSLVLMGFEMAAEWTYLSRNFSRAVPFFSAWVDLRDIGKDISSSVGKDIQPGRGDLGGGIADNAGDDAVATCVLASALLDSENHEKLRFRQECSRIAGRKGYRVPDVRDRFTVSICAQGALPSTINSGMNLARQFFDYSPQSAGIMSEEIAYLTFRSQDQMDQFVAGIHGLVLPTGDILSVQGYSRANRSMESEDDERKEKRELRQRKRLEGTASEVEDLGNLFSSQFLSA
ncbi:hypothetical protein M431DRAFT_482191 [Trichoderma harzianum CBS 226.95]|uniref:Uncharacterized protein n=1 Tax=Trichoderma harzianum CBS 226.95 TaxID=983964 RepID=A0A2T4AD67_TRIHA|nr:hypothetical protein M431DRAFT_482191 [Trichoderma harzianum CBS 226.95]PTB55027.1 hypothetical protein M431DRAFT_482191 [Trichoderma harzianum CBS 226.95]